MTPPPAVLVTMLVLVAVMAFSLGVLVERARGRHALRHAIACYRDLHEPELARVEDELAALQEGLPERLQRAYDAGQAAMVERLTGMHVIRRWPPLPPEKWAALQEARENWESN